MTFDSIWPRLMIPGEFDSMDECDQLRWKSVLQQAYDMGRDEAAKFFQEDV